MLCCHGVCSLSSDYVPDASAVLSQMTARLLRPTPWLQAHLSRLVKRIFPKSLWMSRHQRGELSAMQDLSKGWALPPSTLGAQLPLGGLQRTPASEKARAKRNSMIQTLVANTGARTVLLAATTHGMGHVYNASSSVARACDVEKAWLEKDLLDLGRRGTKVQATGCSDRRTPNSTPPAACTCTCTHCAQSNAADV